MSLRGGCTGDARCRLQRQHTKVVEVWRLYGVQRDSLCSWGSIPEEPVPGKAWGKPFVLPVLVQPAYDRVANQDENPERERPGEELQERRGVHVRHK
ncbi:hypothetical protein TRAPUB_13636 [Trametes pubescens]|uniref:Uncharacterized protein n=1 Tax=Trametes pubescens TaxID=154538 RepID=A0A1M2VQM0_TRAPU|nr:hypothetical protein TRAPUB_13636 [Trametes pubescens]